MYLKQKVSKIGDAKLSMRPQIPILHSWLEVVEDYHRIASKVRTNETLGEICCFWVSTKEFINTRYELIRIKYLCTTSQNWIMKKLSKHLPQKKNILLSLNKL